MAKTDLTPARLKRAGTLIAGGLSGSDVRYITKVRTTAAFEALLYAGDDGSFLYDDKGEVTVPMPPGTPCEVCDIMWIGGSQGLAFYIKPIGEQYPDPVPLQIDEADLVDGVYPFIVEEVMPT